MRKTFRYILPVAMTLTLVACGKVDVEPEAVRDCPTFSAMIDGAHTRAADDYWEKGDEIGISGGSYTNIRYVTGIGDGNFIAKDESEKIYFLDNDELPFIAYHPWYDFSGDYIQCNTSDQSLQKSFDFLWASAVGSKNSPNVEFKFAHKMSKVTFVFKNGTDMDVSTINKIKLNGLVAEGTFDTTTGICEVNEDSPTGSITMALTDVKTDKSVNPLFLFPQTVTGSVKLEIYDSKSQYFVCNLTIPDNEFVAGTNYEYVLTVNKTGLKVNRCSITDWITESGEDSEASSTDE